MSFFNQKDIEFQGKIILKLKSRSWTARECEILVVEHQTHNLMGRDIRCNLGLSLRQTNPQETGNQINSIPNIEVKIS